VRLPEPLRHGTGAPRAFAARLGGDAAEGGPRIVLTPVDGTGPSGAGSSGTGSSAERADVTDPAAKAETGPAGTAGPPGTTGPAATAQSAPPLARLVGVRIAFGQRTVLDGVDLDVRAGALLVVRGRSGSGKSTLLRLLVGLERPDEGVVTLDGTDLAGLDRDGLADLRRRLTAVVGQDVHLAETVSVRANVELARAVRGQVDGASGVPADLLGLAALADRPVEQLSGGERQRAAVFRALSVGARLIVLDEPSSQLDEASAEQLAAALVAAAGAGTAVVVASHDPVLVAAAHTVIDLEH
jgi:ABC-type lipoprotein export system ATPase subunit